MSSPGSGRGASGRTRGAQAFIARVEGLARTGGFEFPGLNHWLAVATAREFLARTLVGTVSVAGTRATATAALDRGDPGPRLDATEVEALAVQSAATRGCQSLHEWDLVWAVLKRAGLIDSSGAESLVQVSTPLTKQAEPEAPAEPTVPAAAEPSRPKPTRQRPQVQPRPAKTLPTPMLDQCGIDLTARAAQGEIGPVVGREHELDQLVETLCRPTKANPMLVGEPGVGKSALVEGLAQRIVAGDVPPILRGRRLVSLDMAALVQDSRWYGALEQRLTAVVTEARAVGAILFIDEGQSMVAAGGREGTGDVATFLKPILARGDLAIISATTNEEYRRFIAPNAALERRFVVISVGEPTPGAVREILRSVRDRAASVSGIAVDDAALEHVLSLAAVRFPHRRQPDKSKDLLEQAIASALSRGATAVDREAIEAAADRLAGAPAVDGASLGAMEAALVILGLLAPADAAALVERLAISFAGLALRPEHPRAVALVLEDRAAQTGGELAATIAEFAFGSRDRVVAIDLAPITGPELSGLLGTTQGFVGFGAPVRIHEILSQPHCVARFQNVTACHAAARAVMAHAIREGFLTDATGKRIYLSSAIVVLEAMRTSAPVRGLGFGARTATAHEARSTGTTMMDVATALVGDELAAECDLIVSPPAAVGDGAGPQVGRLLRDLAARYQVAGVALDWSPAVEVFLGVGAAGLPTTRLRERFVEEQFGRAVRPHLRGGTRPLRVTVGLSPSGLAVEPTTREVVRVVGHQAAGWSVSETLETGDRP